MCSISYRQRTRSSDQGNKLLGRYSNHSNHSEQGLPELRQGNTRIPMDIRHRRRDLGRRRGLLLEMLQVKQDLRRDSLRAKRLEMHRDSLRGHRLEMHRDLLRAKLLEMHRV